LFTDLDAFFEHQLHRNQAVLAVYCVERQELHDDPYGPLGIKLNFFLHHLIILAQADQDVSCGYPFTHPTHWGILNTPLPNIPDLTAELLNLVHV
jgi:hypothetical protein